MKHQAKRSLSCSDKSFKTLKESTSGCFGLTSISKSRTLNQDTNLSRLQAKTSLNMKPYYLLL